MSLLNIEVVYAMQSGYRCLDVQVVEGTTIEQAIIQSGMLALFSEIDLTLNQVGIYNQIQSLSTMVKAGDRVEIYRPLKQSAMVARNLRAKTQKKPNQRSGAKDRV